MYNSALTVMTASFCLLLKPEGVEQSFSKTLFLELPPLNRNISRFVSFSSPSHVVPGSQRTYVAYTGTIIVIN